MAREPKQLLSPDRSDRLLCADAGKYIIHFGDKPEEAAEQAANTVAAAHPDRPRPDVTALAKYRNPDMSVVPTSAGDQLVRRQRAEGRAAEELR